MPKYMTRGETFLFWIWFFSIPLAFWKIGNILICNSCKGPENLFILLITLGAYFLYLKFSFKLFFETIPALVRFFESKRGK
ncbi:hypothetical protein BL107_09541 [Synechococcus sp. BL107]|nr:hypothetical protein BL107_09541 [Synechococcus sp. BL107]